MVVAHSGRQQLRRAAARLPAYLRWAEGIIGVEPCQSQDLLNQMNIYHDKAWNKFTKALGSVPYILDGPDTKEFVDTQYNAFKALVEKLNMQI